MASHAFMLFFLAVLSLVLLGGANDVNRRRIYESSAVSRSRAQHGVSAGVPARFFNQVLNIDNKLHHISFNLRS
jgi:hypothetical protein